MNKAQRGLTINSMRFFNVKQLTHVDGKLLAIFLRRSTAMLDNVTVDVTLIKHETVTLDSFYIGLSTDNIHWTFIDCEGVTQEYLAMMVPGYQKTLTLDGCKAGRTRLISNTAGVR